MSLYTCEYLIPDRGSEAGYEASENVIIGNTCLYGATGGALFANGRAGERFAVRNSMADAVVEVRFKLVRAPRSFGLREKLAVPVCVGYGSRASAAVRLRGFGMSVYVRVMLRETPPMRPAGRSFRSREVSPCPQ